MQELELQIIEKRTIKRIEIPKEVFDAARINDVLTFIEKNLEIPVDSFVLHANDSIDSNDLFSSIESTVVERSDPLKSYRGLKLQLRRAHPQEYVLEINPNFKGVQYLVDTPAKADLKVIELIDMVGVRGSRGKLSYGFKIYDKERKSKELAGQRFVLLNNNIKDSANAFLAESLRYSSLFGYWMELHHLKVYSYLSFFQTYFDTEVYFELYPKPVLFTIEFEGHTYYAYIDPLLPVRRLFHFVTKNLGVKHISLRLLRKNKDGQLGKKERLSKDSDKILADYSLTNPILRVTKKRKKT